MNVYELPNSALQQLQDRLEYADYDELVDLCGDENYAKELMNREIDINDVYKVFDGIYFVPEDFGSDIKLLEEIQEDVLDALEAGLFDICGEYNIGPYIDLDPSDVDKIVEGMQEIAYVVASEAFRNQ